MMLGYSRRVIISGTCTSHETVCTARRRFGSEKGWLSVHVAATTGARCAIAFGLALVQMKAANPFALLAESDDDLSSDMSEDLSKDTEEPDLSHVDSDVMSICSFG
jgi:hypothetical protein